MCFLYQGLSVYLRLPTDAFLSSSSEVHLASETVSMGLKAYATTANLPSDA